jgi:hypothetical protein
VQVGLLQGAPYDFSKCTRTAPRHGSNTSTTEATARHVSIDGGIPVLLLHLGDTQKEVCLGIVGCGSRQLAEYLHCLWVMTRFQRPLRARLLAAHLRTQSPLRQPQDKWQQRRGWRRVPLVVRGRAVHLLAEVLGLCRRVGWGEWVFFVIVVRGNRKRTKRGKSRAPMAFWVQAVLDGAGGWQLPVSLEVLLLKLWQRWEVGFCWMKSGFELGEKPCWGFESGERSVAWSAWVYGALVWSGYCAWGGWTGGARWGGCRGRAR